MKNSLPKGQILAMEAGPELDVLVATEVMGYLVEKEVLVLGWRNGLPSLTRDQYCILDSEDKKQYALGPLAHGTVTVTVPEYSTNISAAWQVVKEMQANAMMKVRLVSRTSSASTKGWSVHFVEVAKHKPKQECRQFTGFGSTAPEAICKAALVAKIKEVEDAPDTTK